jgi:hypothetical protein
MAMMSGITVAEPRSPSVESAARAAVFKSSGSRLANIVTAPLWPVTPSRIAGGMRFEATPCRNADSASSMSMPCAPAVAPSATQ